jgi:CBS domain-containing protein
MTTVADVMTRGVRTLGPNDSVVDAARCMDELNVGVIPVCDGEKLVGMVTDRDIVVRGVAQQGEIKSMKLADVMSANVRCAREGDDVDQVLSEMAEAQIRRLPVVDGNQRLVGIVTPGRHSPRRITRATKWMWRRRWGDISSPAEPDRSGGGSQQSQSRAKARNTEGSHHAESLECQRERQYEHIKSGLKQHGKSEKLAEEIAARTVNKERAQHGEAKHASAQSLRDMPASRARGPAFPPR